MKTKATNWIMLIALSFLLVACGGEDTGSGSAAKAIAKLDTSTPDGAFKASLAAMKSNDIKALIKNSLSDDQYNDLVSEFEANKGTNITESDKAQFAQAVTLLTSDGAENTIYSMVEPKLEQARAMLPFMLSMGKDQAMQSLKSMPNLADDQKDVAVQVAGAMMDWLGENDVLGEEVTKKAISEVVSTAKALNMTSLDEVQNMNFDQALEKGSVVMGGLKNILNVYGVSIDDMVDSVELSNVETNGDAASMDVTMKIFGEEISQSMKMIKKAGQWVSEAQ